MRGMDQVSSNTFGSTKSPWYLTMCPLIDACVMFGQKIRFLPKGLRGGSGWGGVLGWYGFD